MLIDTQANGTAIKYNGHQSETLKDLKEEVKVELLDGFIEGKNVTDSICLDDREDICIDDFTFVMATEIEYPKVKTTKMAGVIPFNLYMKTDNPTMRLVNAMF